MTTEKNAAPQVPNVEATISGQATRLNDEKPAVAAPTPDIHSPFNACMFREDCRKAEAALAERDAEIARLREDAQRYRWIRQNPQFIGWDSDYRPDEIDTQVDAARGKP